MTESRRIFEAGQIWRKTDVRLWSNGVDDTGQEFWMFSSDGGSHVQYGVCEIEIHEVLQSKTLGEIIIYQRRYFDPNGDQMGSGKRRFVRAAAGVKGWMSSHRFPITPETKT